nr:transcription factor myc2 [Quercus suber]
MNALKLMRKDVVEKEREVIYINLPHKLLCKIGLKTSPVAAGDCSQEVLRSPTKFLSFVFFLKNQSEPESSICEDTRMSHSPPSVPSIFPANKSESGGSASIEMDQIVPQYSHSISSIFPPYKSTECSESNERHPRPQLSNSISSIFPPNKSTESSESNERNPQPQLSNSISSIFPPNKSTESSESNERPPNESTNSAGSPSKLSIQSEYNNQLQAALQKLIEEVRHSWTYAIMWGLSYDHSGMPFLRWADGYYKGSDDYHMETNNRTEKPLSVVLEEQEILASATDEEDVTNTEWFFLKSKTQCFLNGSGLPGQTFHTPKLVWLAGWDHLATSTCNRARMGQASGLQTMVWLPSANGVVELGSTMLIFQSTDMINKEIVMGRPNQLRGGEHDELTQDDRFEEIYQMLATLPPMTEKHQTCATEQQTQGGASPTLPPTPRDLESKFLKLIQGSKRVKEYEMKFLELVRYAPHVAEDEASKCRRFYEGLRKNIRSQIIPSMLRDFTVLIEQAKVVEKNCDHTQVRESKRMRFARTLQ